MPRTFTDADILALINAGRSPESIAAMAGQPSFLAQEGPPDIPSSTDIFQGEEMPGEEPYSVWGGARASSIGPMPFDPLDVTAPPIGRVVNQLTGDRFRYSEERGPADLAMAGLTYLAPMLSAAGPAMEAPRLARAATQTLPKPAAQTESLLQRLLGLSDAPTLTAPTQPYMAGGAIPTARALTLRPPIPLGAGELYAAERSGSQFPANFPQMMSQLALPPANPFALGGLVPGAAERAGPIAAGAMPRVLVSSDPLAAVGQAARQGGPMNQALLEALQEALAPAAEAAGEWSATAGMNQLRHAPALQQLLGRTGTAATTPDVPGLLRLRWPSGF